MQVLKLLDEVSASLAAIQRNIRIVVGALHDRKAGAGRRDLYGVMIEWAASRLVFGGVAPGTGRPSRTSSTALYKDLVHYCNGRGSGAPSQTLWGRWMRRQPWGADKKRIEGVVQYVGVSLKEVVDHAKVA